MKRNRRGRDHSVFICDACDRARCRDGSKLIAGQHHCRECWDETRRAQQSEINLTPLLAVFAIIFLLVLAYGFFLGWVVL